ncbi:MAG: hypothetical protein PGN07_01795 [Aeromicrobium erythreum]
MSGSVGLAAAREGDVVTVTVPTDASVRQGLDGSLRRALLVALAVWQGVMAAVVLATWASWAPGLVLLHAGVALLAVASLRRPRLYGPTLAVAFAVWGLDYVAASSIDDPLTLAGCWFGDLLYGIGALTLRGPARLLVPVGGAVAVAVLVALAGPPGWEASTRSGLVVTALAIVAAVRAGLPSLWRLAADADAAADRLADDLAEREAVRRASRDAAEDARVVHDTVINTLGAIANGGVAVAQPDLVRDRCRRDVEVVEQLLAGRRAETPAGLDEVLEATALRVRRTGDDPHDWQSRAARPVVEAVTGAVGELLRNVEKHAGVDSVEVQVDVDDDVVRVAVTDAGVGFDPYTVERRGLLASVEQRLADVGGSVVVDSAKGAGTTVALTCPLVAATGSEPVFQAEAEAVAGAVVRRSTWLWSVGVVAVGVVIEAVNRPGRLTWTYAMLALVAGCIVLARLSLRGRPRLPGVVQGVLVCALPTGYLLSLAGVDFGEREVFYYQAIGITPLALLLLVAGGRPAWRASLTILAAASVVTAGVVVTRSTDLAVTALVAAAPGLGFALAWSWYTRLVDDLVRRASQLREQSLTTAIDVAAEREVLRRRRLWSTAELRRAASLLTEVADDPTRVGDAGLRERCAEEEDHLRQVLLLSPASVRVGEWMARALGEARRTGVRLRARTGDVDAPDEQVAAVLGGYVLHAVRTTPPGGSVTAGFYPGGVGPQLLVLGATGGFDGLDLASLGDDWRASVVGLGEGDLLEVRPRPS